MRSVFTNVSLFHKNCLNGDSCYINIIALGVCLAWALKIQVGSWGQVVTLLAFFARESTRTISVLPSVIINYNLTSKIM